MNEAGTAGTYTQLYEVYIDTRYEARLRLFYYLHPERNQKYKSIYSGTEIGKSLPILNFLLSAIYTLYLLNFQPNTIF